jgi:pyrroloquinoline quinone biosynthesis protein D
MVCLEAIVSADGVFLADDVPEIERHFRLQFEATQSAWVLLYPEGMVKLSPSAGEIMKRIDGRATVNDVVTNLEETFPGADLRQDVMNFLKVAHERGWISNKQ